MARSDVDAIVGRGDAIAQEIATFVTNDPRSIQFRADLAGLLVVLIVASYETCVKETLIAYAARHHSRFAVYTQRNYEKLNSKIAINDLYRYAKTFDDTIHARFSTIIADRKKRLLDRTGKNFEAAYKQLLDWRHAFAHQGARNTTVEEALATHRLAKRVLYAFDEAFR